MKDNVSMFPGGIAGGPVGETPNFVPDDDEESGFEIDLVPGDEGYSQEDADKAEASKPQDDQDFDDNLAEILKDTDLSAIGMKLGQLIDEDLMSREKWEQDYRESLEYLGIENQTREEPWPNACAIVHPGMLQGIVRFQSRGLGKLFPQQGPAAVAVRGVVLTPQIQILINSTQEMLNNQITQEMIEVQTETDRLLFHFAQIGFGAKKIWFDEENLGRVTTSFVQAENFILPYGCDNIETAQRFTEAMRLERDEFDNLVLGGKYVDLGDPGTTIETENDIEEVKSDITGQSPSTIIDDCVHVYECYVNLYIEEDPYADKKGKRSPYVVTIDKNNQNRVYAIYRNWKEDATPRKKRCTYALYRYVPSDGSYGFGLVQLTGQLIKAATRILRQVIDAGELANLPAILKSNAARMKSQDPIAPGELRDVELSPDQMKEAFFPLPFKEPSPALIKLLELIISEIKDFSSTADLDISASSQNAPVGTTLALIERQTEISNAVQKRMHTSFSRELTLIVELWKEYEEEVYNKIFGPLLQALKGQGIIVIHAFGDPVSSTMSQRVIQLQAVITAAQTAPPGTYNIPALHRSFVSAMGLPDAIVLVPDPDQAQEQGIVEEHMALLNNKPIKAFPDQDQKSHIGAHMAFLNDPSYQQMLAKDPKAQQMALALMAHIAEHLAFEYRNEISEQLGGQLPPAGASLDPTLEQALSQLIAQAAGRVAQKHAAEAQQQQAQAQAADPAYQLEKDELDFKKSDAATKHALKNKDIDNKNEQAERRDQISVLNTIMEGVKHAGGLSNDELQSDIEMDHRAQELASTLGTQLLGHVQHLDKLDDAGAQRDHEQGQNEADRQSQQDLQESQQANQPPAGNQQ